MHEIPTPFSGAMISTEELAALCGYQPNQRVALAQWLRSHGIFFYDGRKGPFTTVAAMNRGLGLGGDRKNQPVEID